MIFSPLQSRSLGTSHSSSNRHYLPHRIFLNLTDGLKSLFCQRWFYFWEKPEVAGCQIWAVRGLSHLGDLMFHQKTLHEMQCVSGRGWSCNHQLPIAAAFWIIQIVSAEQHSGFTQNLMQIRCSTHSVILNVMATHTPTYSPVSTAPSD